MSEELCTEMAQTRTAQEHDEMIPARLPEEVEVTHKTGWITGVRHDSGIVFVPDGPTYVLVLLSRNLPDLQAGIDALAHIFRLVFDVRCDDLDVGTPPPPLRAPALAGDTIDTAEMQGTVRLLFFYGSNCGSCVQKYPTLNRLYDTYDRDHFRLIGIPLNPAADYGVSKEKYPEFMTKYGIEWPQA